MKQDPQLNLAAFQVLREVLDYPHDEGLAAFLERIAATFQAWGAPESSNDVITLRAMAERARSARMFVARHK